MPLTTKYYSNATCIHCRKPLSGPAYVGKTQVAANSKRYLHVECFETPVDVEKVRAIQAGAPNNAGLMYSITLKPQVDSEELRFVLMEARSTTWYVTGQHEYTSPTYLNTKWQRRFDVIADLCPAGTMDFLVMRYDGTVFKEDSFTWTSAAQLKAFNMASLKKK